MITPTAKTIPKITPRLLPSLWIGWGSANGKEELLVSVSLGLVEVFLGIENGVEKNASPVDDFLEVVSRFVETLFVDLNVGSLVKDDNCVDDETRLVVCILVVVCAFCVEDWIRLVVCRSMVEYDFFAVLILGVVCNLVVEVFIVWFVFCTICVVLRVDVVRVDLEEVGLLKPAEIKKGKRWLHYTTLGYILVLTSLQS